MLHGINNMWMDKYTLDGLDLVSIYGLCVEDVALGPLCNMVLDSDVLWRITGSIGYIGILAGYDELEYKEVLWI